MKSDRNCYLCGGKQLTEIFPGQMQDRHTSIPGVFNAVQCTDCGLVFLEPMPSSEELNSFYSDDYYSFADYNAHDTRSVWRRFLSSAYRKIMNFRTYDPTVTAHTNIQKILDIGCGSGQFLASYREKGWLAYGVETNANAAKLGREKYGIDIFCGELTQGGFESDYFDYVRSNHSLEHINNPNEILMEANRILAPGGKIFIGVPNIDGLWAKLFRAYWYYLGAPVHVFNYSVKTLSRMLEKHDFCVESVRYSGNYYGLLGSLQIYLHRKSLKPVEEGLLMHNPVFIILAHCVSKLMNLLRAGDCIEIVAVKK